MHFAILLAGLQISSRISGVSRFLNRVIAEVSNVTRFTKWFSPMKNCRYGCSTIISKEANPKLCVSINKERRNAHAGPYIADLAQMLRITTRQQSGPRWTADRLGVENGKPDTLLGQLVDIGSVHRPAAWYDIHDLLSIFAKIPYSQCFTRHSLKANPGTLY